MSANPPRHRAIGVVELRRYTTHPHQRDVLIDLFDREFIEPQEAVGIAVLGQFRDIDHPDTFTWLRGFPGMRSRAAALTAFYGGPVWARHRDEANATMIDSDDVLLLEPLPLLSGPVQVDRPAPADSLVEITVAHLSRAATDREAIAVADLATQDGSTAMVLRTLHAVNDFPRLPVREDAEVLALARTRANADDGNGLAAAELLHEVLPDAMRSLETFRLRPTPRSRLR